jgi:putative chitinase
MLSRTNAQMEPVEEAYYLGAKADAYRRTLRYFPWYGRGYAQCTWETNYRKADVNLGMNGALIADPSLALKPDVAARILVSGMEEGWFAGKRLDDYLPAHGNADVRQFELARHIINGTDKATLIADHALKFQASLEAGGWA